MSSVATSPATVPRKGGFHRFWRALKQLFLELVGATFAILGLIWLNAALRSWNRDTTHWLIAAAIAFAVLFFFFAASSFRRARKL
jgi:Na+-translocating ferredoxin:NAD+ oxidoreductase RnfA subunit